MKVIRAEVMGMCFGVRDALEIIDGVDAPSEVTIHGQLVHNEAVLGRLESIGFAMADEVDRSALPATPTVLITAHGISDRERRRLAEAGKHLVDTTCPLVTRVHQTALSLQKQDYLVLVIGRRGHVEVHGIVEDLERFEILESVADVRPFFHPRLGIVCQTTATERKVREIRDEVAAMNPTAEIRFIDTVCLPTKEHQRSLERLLGEVDAMVVVGGQNSNNTRELVSLCRERGVPVVHVQDAVDLDPGWFSGFERVGLTAGTSTLDVTIEEVYQTLTRMTVEVGA